MTSGGYHATIEGMHSARLRQIALAFPITAGHHEEMVRGMEDYARQHANWTFISGPESHYLSVLDLKGWSGDGVIADILSQEETRAARRLGVPVVNLSGALADAGIPRVINDHWMIGRMAAEHLLQCELQRFGYYGLKSVWYAEERGRGFAERLAQQDYACSMIEVPSQIGRTGKGWYHWLNELQEWLKTIRPPFGVMAVHDNRARMVVEACRQLGLRVPDDVAVVGVNNDRIACEVSRPTLSSVARNGTEIGYLAAEILDRMMAGRRPPRHDILVAPRGVVARESTDMVALDDPNLSGIVRLLRQHLDQGYNVNDLLKRFAVSRRWLEYRFQQRFGRSPGEYIRESRVERAKQLLLGPEKLSLGQVARACGFRDPRSLRLAFRKFTGMTTHQYRRSQSTHRGKGA